jgi:hypothetical protein
LKYNSELPPEMISFINLLNISGVFIYHQV